MYIVKENYESGRCSFKKVVNKRISISEILIISFWATSWFVSQLSEKFPYCAHIELCGSFLGCEGRGLTCVFIIAWYHLSHSGCSIFDAGIYKDSHYCLYGPTFEQHNPFPPFAQGNWKGAWDHHAVITDILSLSNSYLFFFSFKVCTVLLTSPYLPHPPSPWKPFFYSLFLRVWLYFVFFMFHMSDTMHIFFLYLAYLT